MRSNKYPYNDALKDLNICGGLHIHHKIKIINTIKTILFTFSNPIYSRESIVSGPNFRNGKLHGLTRFEVP